VVECT